MLEAADAIRACARRQGYDERETLVVGRLQVGRARPRRGNLSLFGGAKLIDLRIPGGKPAATAAPRCSATSPTCPRP